MEIAYQRCRFFRTLPEIAKIQEQWEVNSGRKILCNKLYPEHHKFLPQTRNFLFPDHFIWYSQRRKS